MAQIFGFYYLSYLWLNSRIGTFHPPSPLLEGKTRALVASRASWIIVDKLLLLFHWCCCLRHQDIGYFHLIQSLLSLRLTCHGRRRGRGEEIFKLTRIVDASALSEFLRFMCTSTLCLGPESWKPLWPDGGTHSSQFTLVMREARALCAVPIPAGCYQILWCCRLRYRGWGSRLTGTTPAVLLNLPPLRVLVHPPLRDRCMQFSSILVCWAEAPWLSYMWFTCCRLKREEKCQCWH